MRAEEIFKLLQVAHGHWQRSTELLASCAPAPSRVLYDEPRSVRLETPFFWKTFALRSPFLDALVCPFARGSRYMLQRMRSQRGSHGYPPRGGIGVSACVDIHVLWSRLNQSGFAEFFNTDRDNTELAILDLSEW